MTPFFHWYAIGGAIVLAIADHWQYGLGLLFGGYLVAVILGP